MLEWLGGHWLILTIVLAALVFDFINGFHDTANAIATSVLTRALSMSAAVLMAAGLNFAGALVFHAVAKAIAEKVVSHEVLASLGAVVGQRVVLATLVGAVIWDVITWRLGLPSSSSHALIGGLLGAGTFAIVQYLGAAWRGGYNAPKLLEVLIGLLVSPVAGLVAGYLILAGLLWIFRRASRRGLDHLFRRLQVISAAFMAFSHGGNDAQKSMGIITLALFAGGLQATTDVALWVKLLCAVSMGLGTATGGWRIIKTVGRKVMELKPVHGFGAETSAALVIEACTALGVPVSTTHVISSAIIGVGVSRGLGAVRWKIAGQIVLAWVLTFPICAALGALSYRLLLFVV